MQETEERALAVRRPLMNGSIFRRCTDTLDNTEALRLEKSKGQNQVRAWQRTRRDQLANGNAGQYLMQADIWPRGTNDSSRKKKTPEFERNPRVGGSWYNVANESLAVGSTEVGWFWTIPRHKFLLVETGFRSRVTVTRCTAFEYLSLLSIKVAKEVIRNEDSTKTSRWGFRWEDEGGETAQYIC
jgi:hypothetical protein